MANYRAWQGVGEALSGGVDAFSRAKAAKAAATRQEQEDATKKDQFAQEMDYKNRQLNQANELARYKVGESAEAKKIAKRPGEVTVRNLSEGKLLPGELTKIEGILKDPKNANRFGPVAGRIGSLDPYNTQSQDINSQVKATAQMIGKYMEGGVLRAEDIPKYAAMLPALSDTPQVAQAKLENVRALLERKYNTDLESLQQGGYDVSGFQPMQSQVPVGGGDRKAELSAKLAALRAQNAPK